MLKNILETLNKQGYKDLIYTFDIESSLNEEDKIFINDYFSKETINDSRSATFFSLGKENLHRKSIVIINGNELQNILTGITETWFQKLNIIVIALYEKYDDIKTDFIHRVIPNIVKIYEDNYKEYESLILKAAKSYSPTLITLKYELLDIKYNYNNLIRSIEKILNSEEEVILYNMADSVENKKIIIKNIESKYKYCMVSKYMGYIIGKRKKTLLCMPAKLILLDLNILNNRYIDENFKIILFEYNKIEEKLLENWIDYNKIKTISTNNLDENIINEFWNLKEPTVLLVKGGI